MKLNYKRTIFVGFAFFLICTFWQAYDTIIPKILVDQFGMSQAGSGVVMALDNILALFLLPFFGSVSDKSHTKIGKRMPPGTGPYEFAETKLTRCKNWWRDTPPLVDA